MHSGSIAYLITFQQESGMSENRFRFCWTASDGLTLASDGLTFG